MKAAIINADDFGLSSSVNSGIIQAHQEGVLTSASLLANAPGFAHALGLAKEHPSLGIGVHLNAVRGGPLCPAQSLPTLSHNGHFLSPRQLGMRLWRGRVDESDIHREFEAQIRRVIDAGIKPTHLDTEKHMHMLFPSMLKVALDLAEQHAIGWIRWGCEGFSPIRAWASSQSWKALLLAGVRRRAEPMVRASGVRHADHFAGLLYSGRMDAEAYIQVFEHLKEGVTEIVCHPGYVDDEMSSSPAFETCYINRYRESELRALVDPRLPQLCRQLGIRLVHFGQLDMTQAP